MTTSTRTWPRPVVISPSFGAGLSTWWGTEHAYDIVEHPVTVKAAQDGVSWDETCRRLTAEGFDMTGLCNDGWPDALVVIAHSPYIILECDGSESIAHRNEVNWRE
jgi:hypothetical protein